MTQASFFVLTYNQEAFVRESFESVLAQDYDDLQIIISDDHSSDRTFDIIEEVFAAYRGPHRVVINRNPRNIGLVAHLREALARCDGEIIVAGAGDDVYLPQRVSRIVAAYERSGRRATSFHSSVTLIDSAGKVLGHQAPRIPATPYDLRRESRRMSCVIGATHAWSRRTFEHFGPITVEGCYEDLIIAFRSMLIGEIAYIDEPLVKYRMGNGLVSSEQAAPASFDIYLARSRKALTASIAVMRQRMLDVERMDMPDLLRDMAGTLADLQCRERAMAWLEHRPAGPAPGGLETLKTLRYLAGLWLNRIRFGLLRRR